MGKGLETKKPEVAEEAKFFRGSNERDADLERILTDKGHAIVRAWEENEMAKANNKACRKLSEVESWENSKIAALEAALKQIEEIIEKEKAECIEKKKNKMAEVHKIAEEDRARVVARKGEDLIKIEEKAARLRSAGLAPRKKHGCF